MAKQSRKTIQEVSIAQRYWVKETSRRWVSYDPFHSDDGASMESQLVRRGRDEWVLRFEGVDQLCVSGTAFDAMAEIAKMDYRLLLNAAKDPKDQLHRLAVEALDVIFG